MTFATIAPKIWDNGWPSPLPLAGKRPVVAGWPTYNHQPVPDAVVNEWCRRWPNANTGHALGHGIAALDCDVLDPSRAEALAALADDVFGPTPLVRIGRAPKWLRLYRVRDSRIRSRKLHPVEVFVGSGQVALFGTHPDTGHAYCWPYENPVEVAPEELPKMTLDGLESFVAGFAPRCGTTFDTERLRERVRGKHGASAIAAIEAELRRAQPGNLHTVMCWASAALAARGLRPAAIRAAFERSFAAPRTGHYARCWRGGLDDAIASAVRKFGVTA